MTISTPSFSKAFLSGLLALSCSFAFAQTEQEKDQAVDEFIKVIRSQDPAKIAKSVNYPLFRQYPVPHIENEKEFVDHFKEVFDDSCIQVILKSKHKDWSVVGWRGISCEAGMVWLDDMGQLRAVNHETKEGRARRLKLIEADKLTVGSMLRNFAVPKLYMETEGFRIRVDEMDDGQYRFCSWELGNSTLNEPGMKLENGTVNYSGSGGNHTYEFANKEFKYIIEINVIGSDEEAPAYLVVLKNDIEIVRQGSELLKGM